MKLLFPLPSSRILLRAGLTIGCALFPFLSPRGLAAEEIVIEDHFSDAGIYPRDTTVEPKAVDWYSRKTTSVEALQDDSFAAPYSIKVQTRKAKDSPPSIWSHFPTIALKQNGEYLELAFDYRANLHADNALSFFVFGLFNHHGIPFDPTASENPEAYPGYAVAFPADAEPNRKSKPMFLLWKTGSRTRLTQGGERIKPSESAPFALTNENLGSKFHFRFKITRQGNSLRLDAKAISSGQDSFEFGMDLPPESLVALSGKEREGFSFNTIGLGNTIDRVTSFSISNITLKKGR